MTQQPSTVELLAQAVYFAACFAAPVAFYFLAVGCAHLCGWVRRWLPGGFEKSWRAGR